MQISRGFEYGVIHFLAPEAGALADIVEKHLQMDRETTLRLLDFGAIYLANKRIIPFPGQNLSEILHVVKKLHRRTQLPQNLLSNVDQNLFLLEMP